MSVEESFWVAIMIFLCDMEGFKPYLIALKRFKWQDFGSHDAQLKTVKKSLYVVTKLPYLSNVYMFWSFI